MSSLTPFPPDYSCSGFFPKYSSFGCSEVFLFVCLFPFLKLHTLEEGLFYLRLSNVPCSVCPFVLTLLHCCALTHTTSPSFSSSLCRGTGSFSSCPLLSQGAYFKLMHLALQGLLPGLTPPNQTGYFHASRETLLGRADRGCLGG